jgi:putative transcriptional regulator
MSTARPLAILLLLGLVLCGPAQGEPAAGQFLVAARGLPDPNFERSVVLLVHYGADGSVGLVINRPTGVPLSRLFPEERTLARQDGILFAGGPVGAGRFLLLLRAPRQPEESRPVFADVYLGWTPAALQDSRGIAEFRVYSGYAGWAPGQLESEIARGDWRLLPAETPLVFEEHPERIWEELTRRLDTPVAAL